MATHRGRAEPVLGALKTAYRKSLRRGQALTEFALIAPLMVTLLLFSIYFYEINHVKLKVQEAARYAAWEFTGHPLHDYGDTRQSGHFSTASGEITTETTERYTNLKSTERGVGSRYLAVGWSPPRVRIRDQMEPRIPSGAGLSPINLNVVFNIVGWLVDLWSALSFRHANPVLSIMMVGYWGEQTRFFGARLNRFNPPGNWGFNTKGYPRATVTLRFENLFIPRRYMEGPSGWFGNQHMMARRFRFEETTALVADSWRLHYGDNVEHTGSSPYYKTVDRMAFVTPRIKNGLKSLVITPLVILTRLMALTCPPYVPPPFADPMKTALVSKKYYGRRTASGKITLFEDKGSHDYDTSPLKSGSDYESTFTNRGEYHMGCHEPERLTCGASLSSDNPFGDYVVPPPSQ